MLTTTTLTTMLTAGEREVLIAKIRALPGQVATLVAGLPPQTLTAHTLAGEWSVAQNVHHLADSHMNSYIRLKLILTEENPTLRPYDQNLWATTPEANNADLGYSLTLLQGLHERWATLFASLTESQWVRIGFHPEHGAVSVEELLRTYAAHGEGHLDQMQRTLAAKPGA